MNTTFLESSPGNKSSSRLIAVLIVLLAILDANILLFWSLFSPRTDLMTIATAVGAMFASIATPALTYLFFVKRNENPQNDSFPKSPDVPKE